MQDSHIYVNKTNLTTLHCGERHTEDDLEKMMEQRIYQLIRHHHQARGVLRTVIMSHHRRSKVNVEVKTNACDCRTLTISHPHDLSPKAQAYMANPNAPISVRGDT